MFRWTKYLVERSHAGHVDPVDVDVDAGSAQHRHDGLPVRLLDALLEDHLVRETHPSNPWVLPREERGSSGHLLSS